MKFNCLQESLNRGLTIVSKAVGGKLPITSSVLLAAENNQLKMTAINLEMAITAWVGAKVDEGGVIAVPAKLLADFVQSLPNDTITVSNSGNKLALQCGGSKASLATAKAEDFPQVPVLTNPVVLRVDAATFCAAIAKVAFSAAPDQSRPILTGIFLEVKDGIMTLVAADGFRISKMQIPVEGHNVETIIPAKLLIEVSRLVIGSKEPISIAVSLTRGQSIFSIAGLEILTQSLIGSFPAYQSIIPSSCVTEITAKTADLTFAVKSTSVFAQEDNGALKFCIKDNMMTVSSPITEMGSNEVDVVISQDGPDCRFAANAKFVRELLSAVSQSNETVIGVNDGQAAIVFCEVGNDCFKHVMMPMMVTW